MELFARCLRFQVNLRLGLGSTLSFRPGTPYKLQHSRVIRATHYPQYFCCVIIDRTTIMKPAVDSVYTLSTFQSHLRLGLGSPLSFRPGTVLQAATQSCHPRYS